MREKGKTLHFLKDLTVVVGGQLLSDKSTHQKRRSQIHTFSSQRVQKQFNVLVLNSFMRNPHLFRFLFLEYIWFLDQAVMGGTGV